MSLLPTVLQSQTTYAIDAVQDSNSSYYFIPTGDASGGGGSTSNLVSPVYVACPNPATVPFNGITVQSDITLGIGYGYFVQDASSGIQTVLLESTGSAASLTLGKVNAYNSYFVSSQGGTAIGNEDGSNNVITNMIQWNPTDPALTLKLKNPTVITGSSGEGIPYDTVYNPLPPPATPPVPIITSPTAPISIASWNADLTVASSSPAALDRGGLYLVTVSVRIGVGVTYNFPAGSILNLTPLVSGTPDPYLSMTFFLSSTAPQGAINTIQSGLGFYVQGDVISGQLNQASSGVINLGPGGGIDMFIQQVINQYP